MTDIILEHEIAEARELFEGKLFACPCKSKEGKKCWIELRIKVHRSEGGDDPEGENGRPLPLPVTFHCDCDPKKQSPGLYEEPPPRLWVCWPRPSYTHTVAHELMHAFGVKADHYVLETNKPHPGWVGKLMGDSQGTGIATEDICDLMKNNKACEIPAQGKKKEQNCCGGGPETGGFRGTDGNVTTAETGPIPSPSTPGASTGTGGKGGSRGVASVSSIVAEIMMAAQAAIRSHQRLNMHRPVWMVRGF